MGGTSLAQTLEEHKGTPDNQMGGRDGLEGRERKRGRGGEGKEF